VTKRICLVSAGHVSTCPRMHKAADALAGAGYEVRWVFVSWTNSWSAHDAALLRRSPWEGDRIRMTWPFGAVGRIRSGLRFRARRAAGTAVDRLQVTELFRTHGRAVDEIRDRILRRPSDLIYGGTEGGMAPAYEAARALGVPYALDLEDLYGASRRIGSDPSMDDSLADAVEQAAIPGATFCTVPSRPIAAAYRSRFAREFVVVHNAFPLPDRAPDFEAMRAGPLRLCWFSQTIGAGRGLEEVVEAIGISGVPVELRLMGNPTAGYRESLDTLARRVTRDLVISWSEPVSPESVTDWCRGSDVGLCVEAKEPLNKDLCLSNKSLVYPLAGLALACTDTRGQRELAQDFAEGVRYYEPGDPPGLAHILQRWSNDRADLLRARRASWEAARTRWHWAHAEERGRLLGLASGVLGGNWVA
jgi:hypothetical protein